MARTPEQLAKHREYMREWARKKYAENPQPWKDRVARYKKKHPGKVARAQRSWRNRNVAWVREWAYDYRRRKPEQYLLRNARYRAKKMGVPFGLCLGDIMIPEVCPVLGIKIELGAGRTLSGWERNSSPSLDRVDNNKGYVKGNVRVISLRANGLKGAASIEELRAVLEYMEGKR